jgi:[ribosomal protein S5]-alanine N-acetyltransferase
MTAARHEWQLRAATAEDVDGLHALACKPLVYRYLSDGEPPARETIAARVAGGIANAANHGLGIWILEASTTRYAGCADLRPEPGSNAAELTYLLDPDHWGQGLATRMAWTVITHAFRASAIVAVFAGADAPNTASFAVMRRLGMRFRRQVQYPLGPGAEYVLSRGDAGPIPPPSLIRLR